MLLLPDIYYIHTYAVNTYIYNYIYYTYARRALDFQQKNFEFINSYFWENARVGVYVLWYRFT